jgi:hypothetical protein
MSSMLEQTAVRRSSSAEASREHHSGGLPRKPVFVREDDLMDESIGSKIRVGLTQKHVSFFDDEAGVAARIGTLRGHGEYYLPRHRHTFVNLRYLIEGETGYGKEIYNAGDLIYAPESTHYGPQQPAETARGPRYQDAERHGFKQLDMQFMGTSGLPYFRPEELQRAQAELSERGEFKEGVYRSNGHNRDSYEALHEFITGSRPEYPAPRQLSYTVVRSANVPWKPTQWRGVETKHLGYFTEAGPYVRLVRMAAGTATKAGQAPFQQARFIMSGSIEYSNEEYPALSFAYYPPGERYSAMRASSDATLLVVQWATLNGEPPQLGNL